MSVTSEKEITFDEVDREDIRDPHHDRLVITLFVTNHFVKRILVDGGFLVNIILLEAIKRINIPESEIVKRCPMLI